MVINDFVVIWKLLCGRLLAAGGSVASGWVCLRTPSEGGISNCGTVQRARRGSGLSVAAVAGDGPQPCSGAGFMGEVAWALLGKRVAAVLSGLSLQKCRF